MSTTRFRISSVFCAMLVAAITLESQARPETDIVALAFSADGQLAAGNETGTIMVYTAATGDYQQGFRSQGRFRSLAFSPDGRVLVAGSGELRTWNPRTGRVIREFDLTRNGRGRFGMVEDLAFVDADTFVAAVDGELQLWRMSTGTVLKSVATRDRRGRGCDVDAVAASRDGLTIIAGCSNGFAYLWDRRKDRFTEIIDGHGNHHAGPALWISSPSRWLWVMPSASAFGNDLLLRDQNGAVDHLTGTSLDGLMSLALSPDGRTLATGSAVGRVEVWTVSPRKSVANWSTGGLVGELVFSPDSQQLATGGADGLVQMWDARSGRKTWSSK